MLSPSSPFVNSESGDSAAKDGAIVKKEAEHHHHHQHHIHHQKMYRRLAFCISGIYLFFLTWGVLQERITSINYASKAAGAASAKFRHFIVLNLIQAFISICVAWTTLWWQGLGVGQRTGQVLLGYLRVAISGSLSSPFGYAAIAHLNYPTVILGKSCKLVPVMIMNFLVYRKRFEPYKYLTVAMITAGVSLFMLFEPQRSTTKAHGVGSNSFWGLGLLLVNLVLDGLTNSWQDQMFMQHRMRSLQMMFFMSLMMAGLMTAYLLLNPFTRELSEAVSFILNHPTVLPDLLLFGLCGSLGQVFVFYTIEHFGSLSLVTVTVTRKLFTILLSLFWFNHQLSSVQWVAVGIVFAALGLESFAKRLPSSAAKKA